MKDMIFAHNKDNPGQSRIWDTMTINKNVKIMKNLQEELATVEQNIKKMNKWQMNLGFEVSDFPELEKMKKQIRPVVQLWEAIQQFEEKIEYWRGIPLENLNVDEMDECFVEWIKKMALCVKSESLKDQVGPMSFCSYI